MMTVADEIPVLQELVIVAIVPVEILVEHLRGRPDATAPVGIGEHIDDRLGGIGDLYLRSVPPDRHESDMLVGRHGVQDESRASDGRMSVSRLPGGRRDSRLRWPRRPSRGQSGLLTGRCAVQCPDLSVRTSAAP